MKNFQGQKVLITGGSSGIGRATARLLAEQGAAVWLIARRKEALEETLAELRPFCAPGDCGILPADVSDPLQVAEAVEKMTSLAGCPDMVINSAGITRPGYSYEHSLEVYRRIMEVNYFGTLHVIQAVLPCMLARGSGYIVNISSLAGIVGVFGYAAYGASKYAVMGLSEVLRAELKPKGIRVSVVLPPDTDTPQLAWEAPLKPPETKAIAGSAKVLPPEQVARAILRGVQRGRFLILPGFDSKAIYWVSRLLGPIQYPILDFLARRTP